MITKIGNAAVFRSLGGKAKDILTAKKFRGLLSQDMAARRGAKTGIYDMIQGSDGVFRAPERVGAGRLLAAAAKPAAAYGGIGGATYLGYRALND